MGTSFGKKIVQKLNCIDNNPLVVIATLLTIYLEVLPSIINVGPINPWDLFKTLCTGTTVHNLKTSYSRPAGKLLSSSKRISTIRSALQMRTPKSSSPRKKKRQAEAGEARLSSNCLLLQLSTDWYLTYIVKDSSGQIGSLECLGYSYPRCSSFVKSTQAQMGIC